MLGVDSGRLVAPLVVPSLDDVEGCSPVPSLAGRSAAAQHLALLTQVCSGNGGPHCHHGGALLSPWGCTGPVLEMGALCSHHGGALFWPLTSTMHTTMHTTHNEHLNLNEHHPPLSSLMSILQAGG